MNLRHRLNKLEELVPAPNAAGEGQRKLLAFLTSIANRLQASGDVEDRTDASPAERTAMAMVRGDREAIRAIMSKAAGRELTAADVEHLRVHSPQDQNGEVQA